MAGASEQVWILGRLDELTKLSHSQRIIAITTKTPVILATVETRLSPSVIIDFRANSM